ncbi:hypothetical protein HYQ45_008714 [Verticillium longisporum]|uniref:Uncharacterized protein n=1 Tax=Verticillium longisporum TaxID=100787 RepID=A0A8I2ZM44_VERLO|nr:hypothetical protein HYQ45_008714 [Verticillium longisporum]
MFRPVGNRLAARALRTRTQTAAFSSSSSSATAPLLARQAQQSRNQSQQRRSLRVGAPLADKPGSYSRTDPEVTVEYPEDHELPSSKVVRGHGGGFAKPTLASFSLEDRVTVITGGARGLGLARNLIDAFKKENPEAEHTPKVTAHYADVSDPESVDACIADVIAKHGRIDNLVTSAGFTENFDAVSYPIDRMRKLWGVNVDGTYLFAIAVAKHLMERKAQGSMVFIGSMSGSIVNIPQPQAPYNAAKAGVRHLAASLAVEWAHCGIRVNCISPGYMLTALTQKILDDNPDLKKKWISLIPQGKMGQPKDLMGPVTFLLSDASQYVTGADLRVDGGYTVT